MNKDLIVAGYAFSSLEEANIARMELSKIEQLNEKLENADISLLYKVYLKSVEKNTFKTPVGMEYLSKIKAVIDDDGSFETVPIPVSVVTGNRSLNESKDMIKTLKEEAEKRKKIAGWSIFINIVLFILILVMFYIAKTSDSPTVLNYKTALINQYSSWEEELSEREAIVSEKEKSLNITR